jgi:hypothetical protein
MAKCTLFSRANYPVIITYKGSQLVLPPNARNVAFDDDKQLSELPKVITKIIQGEKE